MAKPTVIAVSSTALELCQKAGTRSRKGVSISIDDTETEAVFLGLNGLAGLTVANGLPLYPGTGVVFLADSNEFQSIAANALAGIAVTGPVNVRIQEIE